MPSPTTALCQHLHANGNRCGSPALRGEPFCFYHHPVRRRPTRLVSRLAPHFELPPIHQPADIRTAISAVMNGLANNSIDIKRANLLLECIDRATSFLEFGPGPIARA